MDESTRSLLRGLGVYCHPVYLDRTGINPLSDIKYLYYLRKKFGEIRPDLVLNYTIKPNIWGSIAASFCGVKSASMVTGVGYFMIDGVGFWRRVVQGVARRLYRWGLSRNLVVIFQNLDDANDFIDAGLVDRDQVRMVRGSGVNLQHFCLKPLPDAPVFLMIARLLKTKGVAEYIEAAVRVKKSIPSARFLLVGGVDEGPDAIDPSLLTELPQNGIEYLGAKDDVREYIGEASVYVLPSYREGTPRSVLEAMAMGRAVITTDVPGCRETVRDGRNGILVPARDVSALEEAMLLLARDGDLRSRMGEKSAEIASDLFDVGKVNNVLIEHIGF
jgi:glycosyltransferase involved in cell wall biosynthesis